MIEIDEFIRKFGVIGKKKFTFLFGAGASASSNIATASEMIWDFKRRLYSADKSIKITTIEQRDYEFRHDIENWIKVNYRNVPENEYGFFFEKAFPSRQDRKNYITETLKSANPSIGYKIIKFLIENEIIWHYVTTNFDNLIQKVYPDTIEVSEENIKTRKNYIKVNCEYPLVIKLHGDFRYDWLRNTDTETQELNKTVMTSLEDLFKPLGLIIIGYSGRDESVMTFLEKFTEENKVMPFPNGFYWCVREGEPSNKRISELIDRLKSKGIEADFVRITSFDDLLIGIYNQIQINDEGIDAWLSSNRQIQPFRSHSKFKSNYVVLNFMKVIEYPKTFLTFESRNIENWGDLEGIIKENNIFASFFRERKIIAIGDENEIKETFSEYINEGTPFEYYTLTDNDLGKINKQLGFVYGIFYKIFNWHFENILTLKRFGKRVFYKEEKYKKELSKYSTTLYYYKAFSYSLELRDKKLLFILTPYYLTSDFQSLDNEVFKIQQNALISNMWNKDVLEDLIYWIGILKNGSSESIKILFPSNKPCFRIQPLFYKTGEGIND